MTQGERDKLYIARSLIKGKMTIREAAAEISGLSERQLIRLKKGVKEHGDAFVIHKNRGRIPPHAVTDDLKNMVIKLKNSDKYAQANFSHFQELLAEKESIFLSKPTVYRILVSHGFTSPKKHSRQKLHKRRKRKSQKGMLVIVDASPHRWFFDNREFSLHGAIDDATGEILALFFTPHESLEGYFEIVRTIVLKHGLPVALYVDCHSIFRSPTSSKLSIDEELTGKKVKDTQFGRAMRELGINLVYARSPQAKGRIERLWETLQSRLPVELEIAGIKTMAEANSFLAEFIHKYNQRFAIPPREAQSAFRPMNKSLNLDYILCTKETRRVDNGSAFSYHNSFYRVVRNGKPVPITPKAKLTVLKSSKIGLKVEYSGLICNVEPLDALPKIALETVRPPKKQFKPSPPPKNHPWKTKVIPKTSFLEESDREILEALFSSALAWK